MKQSLLSYIFPLFLVVFIQTKNFAQHFTNNWSGNPYLPMSIIIQNATIDGISMEEGDEIALFDTGNGGSVICVGKAVLNGELTPQNPIILTASNDDPLTTMTDGYSSANEIQFRLWDKSESKEILIISESFDPSFEVLYSSLSTSVVASLSGFSALKTYAGSVTNCHGNIIVPIDVENFINVSEFSLILNYEVLNLSYSGFQNTNNQFDSGSFSVIENNGEIILSWNATTPIDIESGTLVELKFTASPVFNQTSENLLWNKTNSYYKNNYGIDLETEFSDGLITIEPIPVDAPPIIGESDVCKGTIAEGYFVGAISNATSYVWNLSPETAGTISGSGTNITIDFFETFSGNATLSVYGSNSCGDGIASDKIINIIINPTANAGFDDTICEEESYTLSGLATNQQSVLWTSSGDGNFDDSTLLSATYTPGTNDISNGSAILTLTSYAISPCGTNAVDEMILSIEYLPEKPIIPDGPTTINLNLTQVSEYKTYQAENTNAYTWHLEPIEAGNIQGSDTIGTVNWNTNYNGITAYVYVTAHNNNCGEISSDKLEVGFSAVGISPLEVNNLEIKIAPNPSNDKIRITIKGATEDLDLIVINTLGQIINQEKLLIENGECLYNMDVNQIKPGTYFLKFVSKNYISIEKVLIN